MEITRGKLEVPQRVVIYGPEGIGKTSLAARFPGAVFIDTEGSTRNFDVARYPDPNSWEGLITTVQYAMQHPENQKTLVIDTADWAEKLCIQAVCDRAQKKGIEDFGYGKGYVYVKEEFSKLLTYLDGCIAAGIGVVITAHAALRKVELPDEMGAYDHWELKLTKNCAPVLKEWCDMLLFCNYKTIVVQDENKKGKAQGGRRVMYTAHHPCWDAKNRHGLPPELPMEWDAIANLFGTPVQPAQPVQTPQQANPINAQPVATIPTNGTSAVGTVSGSTASPAPATPTPSASPAPAPVAAPADPASDGLEGLDPALVQLMQANHVDPVEIQMVVGGKGYFPADMPITAYPPDFVKGCLIGAWPQVFAQIKNDRDEFPF